MNPIELSDRAAALGQMGRYNEEIELCDRALQLDPQFTLAWINKGAALTSLLWFNKGMLYFRELHQSVYALQCFQEAQKLGHPRAAEGLKPCLQEQEQFFQSQPRSKPWWKFW